MKKILLFLLLSASLAFSQTTGKGWADITQHGDKGNSTNWKSEIVFSDSGATSIGPFSADQPLIAIGVTRNISSWDSVNTVFSDSVLTWDSSWTASDFAFTLGFQRHLSDSARTSFIVQDSLDFLPLFEEDGTRYLVQADSMSITQVNPDKIGAAKYFYVEFIDTSATPDTLVPQAGSRTLVLFYVK